MHKMQANVKPGHTYCSHACRPLPFSFFRSLCKNLMDIFLVDLRRISEDMATEATPWTFVVAASRVLLAEDVDFDAR